MIVLASLIGSVKLEDVTRGFCDIHREEPAKHGRILNTDAIYLCQHCANMVVKLEDNA